MRRLAPLAVTAAALTFVVAALLAPAISAGASTAAQPKARRVVMISVPALTWQTVTRHHPPAIMRLLEASAVASLSVRTIGPRTTAAEGYLTLGAGNRATIGIEAANDAYGPRDEVEDSTAAEVYARRTGTEPSGAVFQLQIADILNRAHQLRYGAEPGELGDALRSGGKTAAVIANGDVPLAHSVERHREAAMAVMDSTGVVAGGSVDAQLTSVAPTWPFGVRADEARMTADLDAALAGQDVVLVEAPDLSRLDGYRLFMLAEVQGAAERRAVAAADRLVAHVLDRVDLTRDVVMLVAPAGPIDDEHLTAFSIAGPGFPAGWARSATTRRAGFVTLPDIAPTVLHAFGIEAPQSMSGTLISSDGRGQVSLGDLAQFVRTDDITRFRDRAVGPVSVMFIVFQVLVYGMAALAMTGHRRRLRPYVGAAALGVLAMPPVVFLSGLARYDRLGVVGYTVVVFLASAVLAAGAWLMGRRRLQLAPGLLIGSTLAVLLVDVLTGARLQINTAFGYSPIVAGRFAGYGNLAFALVAIAAIVVGTMIWVTPVAPARGQAAAPRLLPRVLAGVLLLTVLVLDGLPSFGSDVGGVLATLPAFAVTLLLLAGMRISWSRIASIGAATIGVVAAFAAVDLSRPEERRTHLGRFAQRVMDGDASTILQRKAEANISLLTSSVWTYVIPVALAFLAFLTWRRTGFLGELQRSVRGLRPCLIGALVAGVLGFALNDSGVAVPAMMFGILLPYLTWLLLHDDVRESAPS